MRTFRCIYVNGFNRFRFENGTSNIVIHLFLFSFLFLPFPFYVFSLIESFILKTKSNRKKNNRLPSNIYIDFFRNTKDKNPRFNQLMLFVNFYVPSIVLIMSEKLRELDLKDVLNILKVKKTVLFSYI